MYILPESFINVLFNEYYIGYILFNMFVYTIIVYSLFSLFFIFDVKFVKTLTDLKAINYLDGLTSLIILVFLGLAGIPPLMGFVTKFLLFMYFLIKANYSVFILIVIFNLFVMFFYLQNTRFIVSKATKNFFIYKNNYVFFQKKLFQIIVLLHVSIITGIVVSKDLVIIFLQIFSFAI